jgi:transposase-like protein
MTKQDDREPRVPGLAGPQWSEGERSESERNGGLAKPAPTPSGPAIPNLEVPEQARRRRFSAAYKARVVEEAQTCTAPGEVGALLRREGLYSSQLTSWRRQYQSGALDALRDDKRGRKGTKNPLEEELVRLRKHNARLTRRLEQAETIIEIQKKVSTMLGIPLNSIENAEDE